MIRSFMEHDGMLYVLTFMACLSGAPNERCQRQEIAWDGPLMACAVFGQQEAARWIREP